MNKVKKRKIMVNEKRILKEKRFFLSQFSSRIVTAFLVIIVLLTFFMGYMSYLYLKNFLTETMLNGFIALQFVLLLFVLFSVTIYGFFTVRIMSKPIKQLYWASKRLRKGDFKARTKIKTNDELEEVGETLNKAIKALGKMNEEHKKLEKAKTELLSISSHELRSPMTPIKAQLQMILGGYFGKLNKKQKESLNIVLRNTKRLDCIIKDFLEVSRIDAARLKFNFVKTDLKKHIKNAVKEAKCFQPKKKIKIVTKISKLPEVKIDPNRISQILRNLIINSVKFSPEKTKITIGAKKEKNMIKIWVKDQGIGISKKDQKRIFEPFFQAENTIYRKYSGVGLGLSICKGIVESQGGKIWVESELGKGSTFYFTVPINPPKKTKPVNFSVSKKSAF